MRHIALLMTILVGSSAMLYAQSDSVDVTFRYMPAGNPSVVHLPGEFNNWANNSGGSITPNARWTMIKQPDGSWIKTVRLKINGGTAPGGGYEYKINENGSSGGWLADPLNPRTNGSYGNSVVYAHRPTVFPVLPKSGAVLAVDTVRITAGVFPTVGASIDTGSSRVLVDGVQTASFGRSYDASTQSLSLLLPSLPDGDHVVTVLAYQTGGYTAGDSTRITIKAAPLQWLSRSNPKVYDTAVTVYGTAIAGITSVRVVRNGTETTPAVLNGTTFSAVVNLSDGDNSFRAFADKDAATVSTESIVLHRIVDHTPHAVIQFGSTASRIDLNAFASTDPDGDAMTYTWISEDSLNPAPLGIVRTGPAISLPMPSAGEYFVRLEAKDPSGNTGVVRTYFTVHADSNAEISTINTNPAWVKGAIVYEIFTPAFSSAGSLRGITDKIQYLRDLGVNTLWLTPIMDNPGSINEMNGGYSIIDFYNVDESLGTLADFRTLIDSAHANGLRIVLDITPNHVSDAHPWVQDITTWRDYSIYRGFIENRLLGDNRGLGQSIVTIGAYPLYARYTNWSLANLNLSTRATREAMLDVYRYWLRDMRADGFRLDVYWGPQARYGEKTWWRPFREEIKRIKPEALILGETDGTGTGSEVNYADAGGACDAAYDWNWFGQIKSTLSGGDVGNLHNRTSNYSPGTDYNHYTGPNASYFRFMENHDEDRIAQVFTSNVARTKPGAAVMFTVPGMPLIYAGQEVGWKGRRDKINFSNSDGTWLRPWYQRLARLRTRYAALRSPDLRLLQNATSAVYTYLRPWSDANIVCAASFNAASSQVRLNIGLSDLQLSKAPDTSRTYYMNDLLNDSTWSVRLSDLSAFTFALAPFQSRAFLLSDSALFPLVTAMTDPVQTPADGFSLAQNYPNPVSAGEGTAVTFTLPSGGGWSIDLALYDMLGRRACTLARGMRTSGMHSVILPAGHGLSAGTYVCRLVAQMNGQAPRVAVRRLSIAP